MMDTIYPRYYVEKQFDQDKELFLKYGMVKKFSAGDMMKQLGEIWEYIYYINSGIAKFCIEHENGNIKTVALYGSGALYPLYSPPQKYKLELEALTMYAITEVEVIAVRQEIVPELMLNNPEFHLRMTDAYVRLVNLLLFEEINQLFNDVATKICNFLYAYCLATEQDELFFSQEEIADIAGVSRVHVARAFTALRKNGVIETKRKYIKICDSEKLMELCSENFIYD